MKIHLPYRRVRLLFVFNFFTQRVANSLTNTYAKIVHDLNCLLCVTSANILYTFISDMRMILESCIFATIDHTYIWKLIIYLTIICKTCNFLFYYSLGRLLHCIHVIFNLVCFHTVCTFTYDNCGFWSHPCWSLWRILTSSSLVARHHVSVSLGHIQKAGMNLPHFCCSFFHIGYRRWLVSPIRFCKNDRQGWTHSELEDTYVRIAKKMPEVDLSFGQRDHSNFAKTAVPWTPKGKRKRLWAKITWRRSVESEVSSVLCGGAQYRAWPQTVRDEYFLLLPCRMPLAGECLANHWWMIWMVGQDLLTYELSVMPE